MCTRCSPRVYREKTEGVSAVHLVHSLIELLEEEIIGLAHYGNTTDDIFGGAELNLYDYLISGHSDHTEDTLDE